MAATTITSLDSATISRLAERLRQRVSRADPDECWPFADGRGYGYLSIGRRRILAHRLAEELVRGPLPPNTVVRHRCDNPACCNPAHLVRGTQKDNMRDCVERGRLNIVPSPGERNGNAKLSNAAVVQIRMRATAEESSRVLAAEYGVQRSLIHRIATRRAWAHIGPFLLVRHYGPGLCGCGCGQPTSLARKSNARLGHVKGQAVRYRHGHG